VKSTRSGLRSSAKSLGTPFNDVNAFSRIFESLGTFQPRSGFNTINHCSILSKSQRSLRDIWVFVRRTSIWPKKIQGSQLFYEQSKRENQLQCFHMEATVKIATITASLVEKNRYITLDNITESNKITSFSISCFLLYAHLHRRITRID
jgi:hypothetical protein